MVGMTSGTFDLFHHSHLLFLERCKAQCDKLIVGVDSNKVANRFKGSGRPIHDEMHRWNLVNSLSIVDLAFILRDISGLLTMAYNCNVEKIFKCEKFRTGHVWGTEYGAKLIIVPDIPGMISTTQIIRHIVDGIEEPIKVREESG